MRIHHAHLNSAAEVLARYDGTEPFSSFIKKYFAQHKKFGSRDRKQISHLCYCYFRLGKALKDLPVTERIVAGVFLCTGSPGGFIETIRPEWNEKITLPLHEKLSFLETALTDVFPRQNELSEGIVFEKFAASFFIQPDLFLRLRPGKETLVKNKLTTAGISFTEISASCIALPNATKLDEVININRDAVIQDLSSQRVGSLLCEGLRLTVMNRPKRSDGDRQTVWDCCAASGGKSIMAKDMLGDLDLTVSDIRRSIISNLEKRFAEAGITKYESFVADLGKAENLPAATYDLIIADVPCTGSGTWSRTPEQLYHFDFAQAEKYAALQKNICSNIITRLKKGGHLLYITCSVFKRENEEIIMFLKEKFHLQQIQVEVLKGYDQKADTMFAALLQLSLV